MQRMWANTWHGIELSQVGKLNFDQLASSEFYNKYYRIFFEKYSTWAELDDNYLDQKKNVADYLVKKINSDFNVNKSDILSIGCGNGYMEKILYQASIERLTLIETSEIVFNWIRKIIPSKNLKVGFFPEVVIDQSFDLIYLSSFEYALDDVTLTKLLNEVHKRLNSNGEVAVISYTLIAKKLSLHNRFKNLLRSIKWKIERKLGNTQNLQLWGYKRTASEILDILRIAGFSNVVHKEIYNNVFYFSGKR